MATATDTTTTSRRRFLMTAPAAAVLVGKALPSDDGGLKALFARWQAKDAEVTALSDPSDEEINDHMDEMNAIERELLAHPATGIEALKIKARVASQYLDLWTGCDGSIDSIAFRSVFAAIAALAGRA